MEEEQAAGEATPFSDLTATGKAPVDAVVDDFDVRVFSFEDDDDDDEEGKTPGGRE